MRNPLAWFLCAGGLASRLLLAAQPAAFLVQRIMPDDAFFTLVIARNAARGLGLTFEGTIPTNGFHPLWGLVLAPVFKLVADDWIAVRVTLGLGAVLDVLAALILARLADRLVRGSGVVLLLTYFLNPRLVLAAVSGLETPLAVCALGLFLHTSVRVWRVGARKDWGLMGLAGGLAFLARSELAFVVLTVTSAILPEMTRSRRTVNRDVLPRLGAFALGGSLAAGPWLAWSQAAVGTLLQSSAVAIPGVIQAMIASQANVWHDLLWPMVNLSLHLTVSYPGVSWILLMGGLVLPRLRRASPVEPVHQAIAIPSGQRASSPQRDRFPRFLLWAPVLGCLLAVVVHTFGRWFIRPWYFVPLAASVGLAAALIGTPLLLRWHRRTQAVILVALILVMVLNGVRVIREQTYPGQADLYAAAVWLRGQPVPGTAVGAFNAGILGYFSGHPVINLDGVVDWGAIRAREQRRLVGYLVERGGRWLVDWQGSIWGTFGPFLGVSPSQLVELRRFSEVPSVFGPVLLYDVLPVAAP